MPSLSDVSTPALPRRFAVSLLRSGASLAFAAILLGLAISAPNFLSLGNLLNVLTQSAILGILAFGLTVVVIGGVPMSYPVGWTYPWRPTSASAQRSTRPSTMRAMVLRAPLR